MKEKHALGLPYPLDLENLEARIAAYYAADPKPDLHREIAAEMFGVKPEEVTREQRGLAKVETFRRLYSVPASRIGPVTPITKPKARLLVRLWNRIAKGIL